MKEKYMLFRDVPEAQWENGQEKVVELDLSRYKKNSVARYDAKEIQEKIGQLMLDNAGNAIGEAGDTVGNIVDDAANGVSWK